MKKVLIAALSLPLLLSACNLVKNKSNTSSNSGTSSTTTSSEETIDDPILLGGIQALNQRNAFMTYTMTILGMPDSYEFEIDGMIVLSEGVYYDYRQAASGTAWQYEYDNVHDNYVKSAIDLSAEPLWSVFITRETFKASEYTFDSNEGAYIMKESACAAHGMKSCSMEIDYDGNVLDDIGFEFVTTDDLEMSAVYERFGEASVTLPTNVAP